MIIWLLSIIIILHCTCFAFKTKHLNIMLRHIGRYRGTSDISWKYRLYCYKDLISHVTNYQNIILLLGHINIICTILHAFAVLLHMLDSACFGLICKLF